MNYQLEDVVRVVYTQCEGIYVINCVDDYFKELKASERFREIFGESGKYSDMFRVLMFHMRDSSKEIQGKYLEFLPEVKVFNGKYSRIVKIFHNEEPIITQMSVYPIDDSDSFAMLLTVLDDCEYMDEMFNVEKDAALRESYLYSMHVNLDENTCHSINVMEMDSNAQKYEDLTYSNWLTIIVNMIHEADQERFLHFMNPDTIRESLKKEKKATMSCQMLNLQDEYIKVRIMVSRIQNTKSKEFKFAYLVQECE